MVRLRSKPLPSTVPTVKPRDLSRIHPLELEHEPRPILHLPQEGDPSAAGLPPLKPRGKPPKADPEREARLERRARVAEGRRLAAERETRQARAEAALQEGVERACRAMAYFCRSRWRGTPDAAGQKVSLTFQLQGPVPDPTPIKGPDQYWRLSHAVYGPGEAVIIVAHPLAAAAAATLEGAVREVIDVQDFDISDNTRKEAAIAAMEAPLVICQRMVLRQVPKEAPRPSRVLKVSKAGFEGSSVLLDAVKSLRHSTRLRLSSTASAHSASAVVGHAAMTRRRLTQNVLRLLTTLYVQHPAFRNSVQALHIECEGSVPLLIHEGAVGTHTDSGTERKRSAEKDRSRRVRAKKRSARRRGNLRARDPVAPSPSLAKLFQVAAKTPKRSSILHNLGRLLT